jgi:hypothetical protein
MNEVCIVYPLQLFLYLPHLFTQKKQFQFTIGHTYVIVGGYIWCVVGISTFMNAWWPATGPSDVKESYNPPYYEWYQANKVAQILFC